MKYFRTMVMMILLFKVEVVEGLPDFSIWPDPRKVKYHASEGAYFDHSLESENWARDTRYLNPVTGKRWSEPTKIPMQKKLSVSLRQDLFTQKQSQTAMAGMFLAKPERKSRRAVLINVEQALNEQEGDRRQYRVWPHLGLIFVGTVADEEGYEVVIWDEYAAGPIPLEKIVKEGDIVGLSLVVTGIDRGVLLAEQAKKLGAAHVIAGNDSAIFRANQILDLPGKPIQAVFTDNSTTAVRRFFREIQNTRIENLAIPGVLTSPSGEARSNEHGWLAKEHQARKSEGVDHDDVFVVPKLELYPHWEELWSNYRATFGHKHGNPDTVKNAIALFAQGCTRTRGDEACVHCTIFGVADIRIPSRDMVARSVAAYNAMGIDMIFNTTDSAYEMPRVVKTLQELGASWKAMSIYGRAQGIAQNPRLLEEWQKVATERLLINVGLESGSDDILLRGTKKSSAKGCGSRVLENRQAVQRIRESGAHLHCSFIFGSPGETLETCESNIQFIQWMIDTLGHQLDICETDIFWLNFGSPAAQIFQDYRYAQNLANLAGKTISVEDWQRDFVAYANSLSMPMHVEESWYRYFTRIDLETAQAYNVKVAEMMKNHNGSIRGRAFRPV